MNRQLKQSYLNTGNIVSFMLLIFIWAYSVFSLTELPQHIPTKFDSNGNVIETGSKYVLLFLPLAYSMIWLKCFKLDKFATYIKIFQRTVLLRITIQCIAAILLLFLISFIIKKA